MSTNSTTYKWEYHLTKGTSCQPRSYLEHYMKENWGCTSSEVSEMKSMGPGDEMDILSEKKGRITIRRSLVIPK